MNYSTKAYPYLIPARRSRSRRSRNGHTHSSTEGPGKIPATNIGRFEQTKHRTIANISQMRPETIRQSQNSNFDNYIGRNPAHLRSSSSQNMSLDESWMQILTSGLSKYSMVNCLGKLLTNRAFTVSMEVISLGSKALFVSLRYCKNTNPANTSEIKHRLYTKNPVDSCAFIYPKVFRGSCSACEPPVKKISAFHLCGNQWMRFPLLT